MSQNYVTMLARAEAISAAYALLAALRELPMPAELYGEVRADLIRVRDAAVQVAREECDDA